MDRSTSPMFVLGMLQRTGTNYVRDLLALHPDVAPLAPVHEDQLLRWSHHLVAYVDDVSRCWSPEWEVPTAEQDALLRSLGDGIVGWIADHGPGQRVITKMPSVERLANYGRLFPDCPLVIMVRDGRSVVESGVRSFGWSYERAMRRWTTAAAAVLDFDDAHRGTDVAYRIVRYEDLIDDLEGQMKALLDHVGLDVDRFDMDAAKRIPVRGSSTIRQSGDEQMHWQPVERPADFAPKERWSSWDDRRHRRFNEVAGDLQRRLGYDVVEVGGEHALREKASDAVDLAGARFRETKVRLGRLRLAARRAVERD